MRSLIVATSAAAVIVAIVAIPTAQQPAGAHDVRTGQVLWETRLGTSVQGFPVTYSVDGKQYVAVAAGLGGGSPRNVPAAVAPEIKIPQAGQALYVFTLPDRK